MIKGLKKLSADKELMANEVGGQAQLLAEAYQSFFRSKGVPGAYEILKEKTRGKEVAMQDLFEVLDEVEILSESDKQRLRELKVTDYVGYAEELAQSLLEK
jgi:adenylosuccinate lyase